MRTSLFLFTVAAGLLVNSAASTSSWGGSVLYVAVTEVVVTVGTAVSAEYDFVGLVSEPVLISASTLPPVVTSTVTGTVVDFTFAPTPVGFYSLDFTFYGPTSPPLTIPTTDTNVDGEGYIVMLSLAAVPEPSSLVLLGIGAVLGPLAYAWRRRKQGRERPCPAKEVL
jgi:PEP-CTERM motif